MAYVCEINPDYSSISALVSYCISFHHVSTVDALADCVNVNVTSNCFDYFLPSSASCDVVVSSGSGGFGDFYADAEDAFVSFFPVFLSILCVYVVVRVFHLGLK